MCYSHMPKSRIIRNFVRRIVTQNHTVRLKSYSLCTVFLLPNCMISFLFFSGRTFKKTKNANCMVFGSLDFPKILQNHTVRNKIIQFEGRSVLFSNKICPIPYKVDKRILDENHTVNLKLYDFTRKSADKNSV